MTIKKFVAHDLRSAVQQVKTELGFNAIIVTHRKVSAGIEVSAVNAATTQHTPDKVWYYDAGGKSGHRSHTESQKTSSDRNESCTVTREQTGSVDEFQATPLAGNKASALSATHSTTDRITSNRELTDYTNMTKAVSKSHQNNSEPEAQPTVMAQRADKKALSNLVERQITEYAWGEMGRKDPARSRLTRQLLKLDINPIVVQKITETLFERELQSKSALPHALAVLANQLPIYKEDVTLGGGTIALLGATGVGKTTAIAKMAARYALKHGRQNVALITTDGNRLAAVEQLRIYSKILGIPLKLASDDIDLIDALNEFSDKPFVLIDTAGMGPKDVAASPFFDLFSGGITQIKNFLVLPATTHRAALEETAYAFRKLKLDGSIITKVDETTRLGGPLSVAVLNNLPIAYFSDGQNIPEDLHPARAHTLVSRAVSVVDQFDTPVPTQDTSSDQAGVEANVCI
ncbi:MAG: flagellar biosynthesis protein FlhF [Gammaproteobacteria bacterium]|jgi:flagellar biosynthesis protein FlhF